MILENRHPLNSFQIKSIEKLINTRLIGIKTDRMNINLEKIDSTNYFNCQTLIMFFRRESKVYKFEFWNRYEFNEVIRDDLNNVYFFVKDLEVEYEGKHFPTYLFKGDNNVRLLDKYYQTPFVVKQIKIYGENRLRKWNKKSIDNYFVDFPEGEKPKKVYDYLLTINMIVIENEQGEQLCIGGYRGSVGFGISKNIEQGYNFTRDFYRKDELILKEEKSIEEIEKEIEDIFDRNEKQQEEDRKNRELANTTTEPKMKLLYRFSEEGVERFDTMQDGNYDMFFGKK